MIKSLISATVATFFLTGTALAACGPNDSSCTKWVEAPSFMTQTHGMGSAVMPAALPQNLSVSTVSNERVPGLAPDERLCPTTCPVSVHNPNGGIVKDCYNICKVASAPVAPPVQHIIQPVPVPVQYVRVLRPIIYVPQAPQYVQPHCHTPCPASRYGY